MPSEISTGWFVLYHGILFALNILRYWGSYLSLDAPHADSLESGGTREHPHELLKANSNIAMVESPDGLLHARTMF